MQPNCQMCTGLSLPGRGHGGGPPHPGGVAMTEESILCAAASSPASLPEFPRQSSLAPPVLGSAITTHDNRANIRSQDKRANRIREGKKRGLLYSFNTENLNA